MPAPCAPIPVTTSILYTSHSLAKLVKVPAGLLVIPPVTMVFLRNVLSKVLKPPLVHAAPGSVPITPKISTKLEVETL